MFRQSVRQFSSTARANSFARAQLLGRVGKDIEKEVSGSGKEYVRYPIAVQYKKGSPVSWFNIVSFNEKQNNFLTEYVKKGALVHVEVNVTTDLMERDEEFKFTQTNFIQTKIDLISNPQPKEEEI